MGKRRLSRKDVTSGDRLRRIGEQPERFGKSPEIPIENLIVIGASAGGHTALKEVVRGFSRDIPAAVIIMLHMGGNREGGYQLENFLREYTDVPVAPVQSADRLQRGMIYVTPPGQSVFI
jgi:chemotaxis response regulator CheB